MNLEDIQKDKYYLYTPPYGKPARRVKCIWKGYEDVKLVVDDTDPRCVSNSFMLTFNRIEAERYLQPLKA